MNKDQAEASIKQSKDWRKRLDEVLQEMKKAQVDEGPKKFAGGRHLSLSVTHLEDAIMRQGMRMKDINEAIPGVQENPYPESYNAENAKVEPTSGEIRL